MEDYCSIPRRSPLFDAATRGIYDLAQSCDLSRVEFEAINTSKVRRGGCELLETRFFDLVTRNGAEHVFDIGANNGRHTKLMLGSLAAPVHSFEPNPAMFTHFTDVIGAPGLNFNPFGLSNSSGISTFEIIEQAGESRRTTGMSSFEKVSDGYRSLYGSVAARRQVAAHCTGAQYLAARGIGPKERLALWIDVEGHAPAVLEGFGERLAQAHVVLCEVESIDLYTGKVTVEAVIEHFSRAGLTVIDRDFQYYGRFNLLAVGESVDVSAGRALEDRIARHRAGIRARAITAAG